jgi:hypothetical protein
MCTIQQNPLPIYEVRVGCCPLRERDPNPLNIPVFHCKVSKSGKIRKLSRTRLLMSGFCYPLHVEDLASKIIDSAEEHDRDCMKAGDNLIQSGVEWNYLIEGIKTYLHHLAPQ